MAGCEKVSVIIPVYNVEKYLSACLNSCMQQTLHDVEFVCVNDGSTDHSLGILKLFQKKDPRFRIVEKENGGLSSARNAGIRAANGAWVMFLDSDDLLAPDACERVWCETLEGKTDIIVFGARCFPWFPEPDPWLTNNLAVQSSRFNGFAPEILFTRTGSIPFVWRQAYRADFLRQNSLLFDEAVPFGEDTVFQLESFPHAKYFSFIEDPLYQYRWSRPGSLMYGINQDFDKKIEKHLLIVEHICSYWQERNWFSLYGKEFSEWLYEFLIPDIHRPDVKDKEEHLRALKELAQTYDYFGHARGGRLLRVLNNVR